ncbi:MAG TPA: putative sugar nucleotidyl transferase [Candidatus Krumholzibacteria bacterium]|nr:putative sugar nucleotidyl transferase [Candidatus Krumholzibacteria bacterium]
MSISVCIFEDKKFSNFFPLSLAQGVFDLRIGCGTLRSRLLEGLPRPRQSLICREYLAGVLALSDGGPAVNQPASGATLFLNGRLLCFGDERARLLEQLTDDTIAVKGGYVVGARLGKASAADFSDYLRRRVGEDYLQEVATALQRAGQVAPAAPKKRRPTRSSSPARGTYEDAHTLGQDDVEEKISLDLERLIETARLRRIEMPEARLLSFPWQLIEFNGDAIADDFASSPVRGQADDCVVYGGVQIVRPEDVVIGERAVVRAGVVLDASDGPIVIADGALVMPNATIVGPVSVGRGAIVKTGAKILPGTSIGPVCKVGGEVEETIFAAYANKQHDGFLGHSYIGEWVNIGAASNNSDLKNNYSPVRMWCAGSERETGRQFLGLLMGDHTKTGINTLFNTGTVVGFNCNVFSSEMPAKFLPSFSWGHGEVMSRYDLEKAMQTASVVMERRQVKFTAAHRAVFEKISELSERTDGNV